MSAVFLEFVNRGITAGWIVLAVLLLRLLFKRRRNGSPFFCGAWWLCALFAHLPLKAS